MFHYAGALLVGDLSLLGLLYTEIARYVDIRKRRSYKFLPDKWGNIISYFILNIFEVNIFKIL